MVSRHPRLAIEKPLGKTIGRNNNTFPKISECDTCLKSRPHFSKTREKKFTASPSSFTSVIVEGYIVTTALDSSLLFSKKLTSEPDSGFTTAAEDDASCLVPLLLDESWPEVEFADESGPDSWPEIDVPSPEVDVPVDVEALTQYLLCRF